MRTGLLRTVGVLFGGAFIAAILLLSAGRWDLLRIWLYLAVTVAVSIPGVARLDPDLIRERIKPGPGPYDPPLLLLGPGYLGHLIVAGLDIGRYHWSDNLPAALMVIGYAAYVSGHAFVLWSMQANPYFSPKVRLQPERGQHVISTGPYAYVRHPGYAGASVMLLGSGFALGSWMSLVPVVVAIAGIVWRTTYEDRFLQVNLPGYGAYATQVRYRLLPGVW